MTTTITDWLHSDRQPVDVYELLGVPRFHPDRDQLLAAVRAAYAKLLPYQNHKEPKVAERATKLQMELGRAEDILSDSVKLREHQKQIVEGLRGEYVRAAREAGEDWSLDRLQSWLSRQHVVHPERVETVARAIHVSQDETVELGFPETQEVWPVVDESDRESSIGLAEEESSTAGRRVFKVPPPRPGRVPEPPVERRKGPPPLPVSAPEPDADRHAAEVQVEVVETLPTLAPILDHVEQPLVASSQVTLDKPRGRAQWFRSATRALAVPVRIIDDFLLRVAGKENVVLHNVLRALAIVVWLVAAVLAGMALLSTLASIVESVPPDSSYGVAEEDPGPASGRPVRPAIPPPVASASVPLVLEGHTGAVTSVAFTSDGAILASASGDGTVRIWDVATGELECVLEGHTEGVRSVAFGPESTILASGGDDKTLRLWDPTTGKLVWTVYKHELPVRSVAFSPDGSVLASGSRDGIVRLWGPTTGTLRQEFAGDELGVTSLVFSPDNSVLAFGSGGLTVRLWDLARREFRSAFGEQEIYPSSIAFSPDGLTLFTGSVDRTVKRWDVATGECRQTLEDSHCVLSVAVSPDGSTLASGNGEGVVSVWDVAAGELRRTFTGHAGGVLSVAFSPDGSTLASGGTDSTVRLWDSVGP